MELCQKLFVVLFLFSYSGLAAQHVDDELVCLEVVGIAMHNKEPLDGVNVTLYQENEEMEMQEVTNVSYHEHSFMFKLQRNSYYTIQIAKTGFVSRMIAVSTRLPENVTADPVFRYEFEVELFKEKKGVNDYYLDFPVGLIDYDVKKGVFISHGKYTKHIKGKIGEAMKQTSIDKLKH